MLFNWCFSFSLSFYKIESKDNSWDYAFLFATWIRPWYVLTGSLDPENFKEFKLVKRIQLSHNVAKFTFALPTPTSVLGLPIGQHMSCRFVSWLASISTIYIQNTMPMLFFLYVLLYIVLGSIMVHNWILLIKLFSHPEERIVSVKKLSNHILQQLWTQILDTLNWL